MRDIDAWMTVNMHKMNRDKTELVILNASRRPPPSLTSISVQFQILFMTFKCQNGIAPSYLSDLVMRYILRRNLRSADGHHLFDVKYNLRNYGFRSFSVASPLLWNDMPLGIRSCDSLNDFKKN